MSHHSAPEIPTQIETVAGLRVNHACAGDGSPLLLLHGWGVDLSLVWPLAQRLIPRGYACYAPDLPGFGASEAPPDTWDVHDYTRFVLAYMDAHNLERVNLFGHSFGGRLGLILGADHPQRIERMALAGAAGVRPRPSLAARTRLRTYKAIRDGLRTVGLGQFSERLRDWYNGRYGSADFQNAGGVMRETFVRVVNEDLQAYAARVQPSTLLFWGENDTDTPLWQGQRLEHLIPDAGLVVYPGAGHYSYLENLEQTARAMDYFFRQA